MDDAEFDEELDAYLTGRVSPNPDMVDVEIVWARGRVEYGADHIVAHGVTEAEVEEVLFEIPPNVRAKRHSDHPNRTIFWGATRAGRWLFISCEDWIDSGHRILSPITAFEPDEGEAYWSEQ